MSISRTWAWSRASTSASSTGCSTTSSPGSTAKGGTPRRASCQLAYTLRLAPLPRRRRRDGRLGRRLHADPEVKAGVGGLIVGRVLPGDAQAIDGIVHQRDEAVFGGNRRREDSQLLAVAGAGDNLLA